MTAVAPDREAAAPTLTRAQFDAIAALLKRTVGIDLQRGKEQLVKARLGKRMKSLGLSTYDEYVDHLGRPEGRAEVEAMVDVLTTNKTSFFRETPHFDFLSARVFSSLREGTSRSLTLWSAACSSGEEPYSIVMQALANHPSLDPGQLRLLATDICRDVLSAAAKGVYPEQTVQTVPEKLQRRFFNRVDDGFRVRPEVARFVRFARLNLMGRWPMKGAFDAILCRNAMIYFNLETRQRLVDRFHERLKPGGFLLVGHSENLTGLEHRFSYVQPAVYRKAG